MTRNARIGASAAAVLLLAGTTAALLEWRARTAPKYLQLPDGAEAFFHGDSKVKPAQGYPAPREIAVDGDIFFRIPASEQPLIMRSRLLVLTITGKTALRITAYSKEAGEQVEVLYGNVRANKNYESSYKEPDFLTAGEMTMINRDIDLMEKEKTDLAQLRAWADARVASVQRARR